MANEVNNWWDGYLEFGPSGVPDDATSVKYIGEPYGLADLFHQTTTLKTIDLETICYLDNENIIWLFGRVGGYDFQSNLGLISFLLYHLHSTLWYHFCTQRKVAFRNCCF